MRAARAWRGCRLLAAQIGRGEFFACEEVMPEDRDELKWAEWVKDTCLLFGTTVATAYEVAGLFVKAINEKEPHENHDLPHS